MRLGGTRSTVTESWTTLTIDLSNTGSTACDARVVIFYEGERNVQYARDIWVPANSRLSSTLTIGPAPPQASKAARDIQMLLYDRTGGQNTLIFPPTQEKVRSRGFAYLPRERSAAILVDDVPTDLSLTSESPRGRESRAVEAIQLSRAMPLAGANERISIVPPGYLPPTLEAFDGIDSLIWASNRYFNDPTSISTLRQWLQQGGRLWIMLDLVELDGVAALLGEDADMTVVDRVPLTSVGIVRRFEAISTGPSVNQFERPVELVRVSRSGRPRDSYRERLAGVVHAPSGRGQILFTTWVLEPGTGPASREKLAARAIPRPCSHC